MIEPSTLAFPAPPDDDPNIPLLWAIAGSRPVEKGPSNMFGALVALKNVTVRYSEDLEQAETWLAGR